MDFLELGKFNRWAGERLREVLKEVTEEEFIQKLDWPFYGSLSSLQTIIQHMAGGLEFAILLIEGKSFEDYKVLAKKTANLPKEDFLKRWKSKT